MKKLIIISVAIILAGCAGKSRTGFEGSYAVSFKNEYSAARDTITITADNDAGKLYQLERRSTYQRIRAGKLQPAEHKKESWTATYDENKMMLSEGELGRQVYLRPGFKSLFYGIDYQRIN